MEPRQQVEADLQRVWQATMPTATAIAERVVKQGLNVRQTEGLVSKLQKRGTRRTPPPPETVAAPGGDPHVADLEAKLREVFATKVQLHYDQGKGSVEISFFSEEELERILQILGIQPDL